MIRLTAASAAAAGHASSTNASAKAVFIIRPRPNRRGSNKLKLSSAVANSSLRVGGGAVWHCLRARVCDFAPVHFLPLIEAKREGQELAAEQIQEFIRAYTTGQIPSYQVAAFLMAVYFRGLTTAETRALTLAMRDSGEVLQFPPDPRPLVDKHSTGGIGDKVSLPLAPLLACLGFRVPMISGRGLGITGGTLDKLDSIPGFQSLPPAGRIVELVQRVGCVIGGQTERMVPADKELYALRDATATVPSIPLIVASILSKKLAEGLGALVLDVKFGAAAFMPTREKARALAHGETLDTAALREVVHSLHVIDVGGDPRGGVSGGVRDLGILAAEVSPPIGFPGMPARVTARIYHAGDEPASATVTLWDDERRIAAETTSLAPGAPGEVALSVTIRSPRG